jgi:hypothetical protein
LTLHETSKIEQTKLHFLYHCFAPKMPLSAAKMSKMIPWVKNLSNQNLFFVDFP